MQEKEQILQQLHEKINRGEPIIACAAGAGLIARLEEKSGADLIVVYNSGRYRMNGIASIAGNLPIGDANQIVYEMGRDQILPMVHHTPVVAGIYGVDPTRDMRRFLQSLWDIGYRCVINFPTIGKLSGPIRRELEQVGLGFALSFPASSWLPSWALSPLPIAIARRRPKCLRARASTFSFRMWDSLPAGTWA